MQQIRNCGRVEPRNLIAVDDKHEDLAVAVGLRESKLTGHEDFADAATGGHIDHGDRPFYFTGCARRLGWVARSWVGAGVSGPLLRSTGILWSRLVERVGADGEQKPGLCVQSKGSRRGAGGDGGDKLKRTPVKDRHLIGRPVAD